MEEIQDIETVIVIVAVLLFWLIIAVVLMYMFINKLEDKVDALDRKHDRYVPTTMYKSKLTGVMFFEPPSKPRLGDEFTREQVLVDTNIRIHPNVRKQEEYNCEGK